MGRAIVVLVIVGVLVCAGIAVVMAMATGLHRFRNLDDDGSV